MTKRVLFLISDTGGGHRAGAQAVGAALDEIDGATRFEWRIDDIATHCTFPLSALGPAYSAALRYAPPIYGALYHATNGRRRYKTIVRFCEPLYRERLREVFQQYQPDVGQGQTLTIHLSNSALGTLSGPLGLVTNAAGDYVLTGTAAIVQAAARALLFTPSATGSGRETFSLTLDDGAGGVATGSAALTIEPAAHPPTYVPFPISAQTVLTSTATGSSTFSQVQTYAGAIGNVNTQFLYDGDTTLAIVAQQSGMLISSQAQATAVQLQGGVNVLDMQKGSSFVVSGTGTDTFLLHADQALATWNTISNFHTGDTVIVYGFNVATSARWWVPSAGAIGYTGATLRFDLDGNGSIDSSLTFAGKTQADVDSFQIRPGTVGGSGFLSISAV